jgi:hypothetical protein
LTLRFSQGRSRGLCRRLALLAGSSWSNYPFVHRNAGALALLLVMFLAVNCISLAVIIEHPVFVSYGHLFRVMADLAVLAAFVPLFLSARFSLGYLVGVSFYGVIAGFIWMTHVTGLNYDHGQARLSAMASLAMFLLPLLFQVAPLRPVMVLSQRTMSRLLILTLCFSAAVLLWNAYFGAAFVGIHEASELRSRFARPALLNYITGSLTAAALPFAFAWFALQRRYGLAAASICLIVLFYPVLLNKTVLLAALWLPYLFLMFRMFEPKRATVLALLIPVTASLVLYVLAPAEGPVRLLAQYTFGLINVRMFAIPSIAMNYYSEFFATAQLTGFCQINVVRALFDCPNARELGPIFSERYGVGNLNASLFSTEGIASVGPVWAPVSAFVCGLIISLANSISARLPPPLIAASAGLVVQALMNVPLSTALLTNGLFVLLLLWSVTPNTPEPGTPYLLSPRPARGPANSPGAAS